MMLLYVYLHVFFASLVIVIQVANCELPNISEIYNVYNQRKFKNKVFIIIISKFIMRNGTCRTFFTEDKCQEAQGPIITSKKCARLKRHFPSGIRRRNDVEIWLKIG